MNFAVTTDHREKLKECEKKEKYLDPTKELKKLWNMKVTIIPIVIDALTEGFVQGLGNKTTCWDHPNYGIVETGQNTEKSPGDLRRLAVT